MRKQLGKACLLQTRQSLPSDWFRPKKAFNHEGHEGSRRFLGSKDFPSWYFVSSRFKLFFRRWAVL